MQSAPHQSLAGSAAAAPPGEAAAAAAGSPAVAPGGSTVQQLSSVTELWRQACAAEGPRDVEVFAAMSAAEVEHEVQSRAIAAGLSRDREAHERHMAEQDAASGAGGAKPSATERRGRRCTARASTAGHAGANAGAQAPERSAAGGGCSEPGGGAAAAAGDRAAEDPARPSDDCAAAAPADCAVVCSDALAGGGAPGPAAPRSRRSVGGRGGARPGAARRDARPALPACAEAADEGQEPEETQRPAATRNSPAPPRADRAASAGPAHEPASAEQAGQGSLAAGAVQGECAAAPAPATEPKHALGSRTNAGARRRTMAPRGGAAKARANGEENRPPGPRCIPCHLCMRSGLQILIHCGGTLRT